MREYIKYHSIQQKYKLTKTELEIIDVFLKGYLSCKEIGNYLNIKEKTVGNHLMIIRRKTQCFSNSMLFRLFLMYKKEYIINQVIFNINENF